MSYDQSALMRAYLENILTAVQNQQLHQAEGLTQHALDRLGASRTTVSTQFSYGIGLDEGIVRAGRPNEDGAFAASFVVELEDGQPKPSGLFVSADGMGGHARGADASRLAIHTCVDVLLPSLMSGVIKPVD